MRTVRPLDATTIWTLLKNSEVTKIHATPVFTKKKMTDPFRETLIV